MRRMVEGLTVSSLQEPEDYAEMRRKSSPIGFTHIMVGMQAISHRTGQDFRPENRYHSPQNSGDIWGMSGTSDTKHRGNSTS